jgi:adenylate cyclase
VTAKAPSSATQPAPSVAALPPRNGLPVLLMPAFQISGTPGPHSISGQSLHDALSGAFTRFDLVNVMLEPRDRPAGADGLHADYRFVGSVEYSNDGDARLLFRLIDTADDSIAWSRVFDHVPADDPSAEEKVVRELAGTLLQPFGVIYALQRNKVLAGTLTDARYRCLVDVIDSFSSFDSSQQSRGYDCLEQLTTRDPTFALGFSYLAALDLREYQYGIDPRAGAGPPLDRGLVAARRGVELSPASSRAYEMLFVILFARRDIAAAFDAANRSITLNKYDMRSLGAYGSRLIAIDDVDKGLAVLREAGGDGTVRPPFEDFFLFLGEYLRNDATRAAFYADQLTNDSFQLGLISRALVAAERGDRDLAARSLAWLVTLNPAWRNDLRGTLAKFFYAAAVIDRLADGLTAAGLTATP